MEKLVEFVAQQYDLPSLDYVAPVEQGFLSQNHILATKEQRFFLKQYRFTAQDGKPSNEVAIIHRAKFHFAANGIPAILPVPNQANETFFHWGKDDAHVRCFALFPYVEGVKSRRGNMSQSTLVSAGQTLGQIHRAGHNELNIAPLTKKAHFNASSFWEKTARMLDVIEKKERKTSFDELAQEVLHLKRRLAETNPPIFQELGLTDDHLVHGDYQNDNFFVDDAGRVSYIFDWELTKVTAREVMLLRSILFMCLQTEDDYGLILTDETLAQAETYLQSYHDTYPVTLTSLSAAVENRHLGNIYSTWIEEEHYLKSNDRVDVFLPGTMEPLRYLAQHREEFTARLLAMIDL